MSLVSIINRNFLKTAVSARSLSWHPSNVHASNVHTSNRGHICLTKTVPAVTSSNGFQCRFKYDKSYSKKGKNAEDDDSSSTKHKEFEDPDDSNDTKITTVRVTSLRMDLMIKSGLGLARNKVEAAFYESRIRVNGQKVQKKSVTIRLGDEIDLVKSVSPVNSEHLIVSRLEVLKATANEEDISIAVRRYKSLTIENYSGKNAYKPSTASTED